MGVIRDRLGFQVFAGVRRQADAEALRQAASPRLVPLFLEVTDPEQVSAAAAQVAEQGQGNGLTGLVNNAGIAVAGPLLGSVLFVAISASMLIGAGSNSVTPGRSAGASAAASRRNFVATSSCSASTTERSIERTCSCIWRDSTRAGRSRAFPTCRPGSARGASGSGSRTCSSTACRRC